MSTAPKMPGSAPDNVSGANPAAPAAEPAAAPAAAPAPVTHTPRGEKAKALFLQGYNCTQSVVLAFGDLTGLDEKTAAMLSSSFGGGMGRLREVCGALSGAFLVAGCLYGYSQPRDLDGKKEHYARVRDIAARFKAKNGSYICRELLSGLNVGMADASFKRTDEYYKKRPCGELVADAADIINELIKETGSKNEQK